MSLLCLQVSKSKLLKDWSDIEEEVTYCFNEAKDNAKFIQALEKCCHCLYLDDPVSKKKQFFVSRRIRNYIKFFRIKCNKMFFFFNIV